MKPWMQSATMQTCSMLWDLNPWLWPCLFMPFHAVGVTRSTLGTSC